MIILPLLNQSFLNLSSDIFLTLPGWAAFQSPYWVMSTLRCFIITYFVGFLILKKGKVSKVGRIVYRINSFAWRMLGWIDVVVCDRLTLAFEKNP